MIELALNFFGDYLLEFMTFLLFNALLFRYFSLVHSKDDEAYYSKFTRELDMCIDDDKNKSRHVDDVQSYMSNILGRVNKKLPDNSLRFSKNKNISKRETTDDRLSLGEYVGSKHGLIASIQAETSVFNCQVPPDFPDLTDRIMNDDKSWTTLFGHIPIEGVSRMIDTLPSLFIVFGVFGTFIGIAQALPEIANLDFSNIDSSADTLTLFVVKVSFAMKTSIAGIFFSLILTFLNTFFPIEEMRERTFKKVETSMQLLWYHIQDDSGKAQDLMPEILQTLKEISKKLSLPKELNDLSKRRVS